MKPSLINEFNDDDGAQLEYNLKRAMKVGDAESVLYYLQIRNIPNLKDAVSLHRFRKTPEYKVWKKKYESNIKILKNKFHQLANMRELKITKEQLKNVIKELIKETIYRWKSPAGIPPQVADAIHRIIAVLHRDVPGQPIDLWILIDGPKTNLGSIWTIERPKGNEGKPKGEQFYLSFSNGKNNKHWGLSYGTGYYQKLGEKELGIIIDKWVKGLH
jgi:hypothetical protein